MSRFWYRPIQQRFRENSDLAGNNAAFFSLYMVRFLFIRKVAMMRNCHPNVSITSRGNHLLSQCASHLLWKPTPKLNFLWLIRSYFHIQECVVDSERILSRLLMAPGLRHHNSKCPQTTLGHWFIPRFILRNGFWGVLMNKIYRIENPLVAISSTDYISEIILSNLFCR